MAGPVAIPFDAPPSSSSTTTPKRSRAITTTTTTTHRRYHSSNSTLTHSSSGSPSQSSDSPPSFPPTPSPTLKCYKDQLMIPFTTMKIRYDSKSDPTSNAQTPTNHPQSPRLTLEPDLFDFNIKTATSSDNHSQHYSLEVDGQHIVSATPPDHKHPIIYLNHVPSSPTITKLTYPKATRTSQPHLDQLPEQAYKLLHSIGPLPPSLASPNVYGDHRRQQHSPKISSHSLKSTSEAVSLLPLVTIAPVVTEFNSSTPKSPSVEQSNASGVQLGDFSEAIRYLSSQKNYWQSRARELCSQSPPSSPSSKSDPSAAIQSSPTHTKCTLKTKRLHVRANTQPEDRTQRHQPTQVDPAPIVPSSQKHKSRSSKSKRRKSVPPSQGPRRHASTTNGASGVPLTHGHLHTGAVDAFCPQPCAKALLPVAADPGLVPRFKRGSAAQAASELLRIPVTSLTSEPPIPYYYGDIPRKFVARPVTQSTTLFQSLPLARHRHSIATLPFPHSLSSQCTNPFDMSTISIMDTFSTQVTTQTYSSPSAENDLILPLTAAEKTRSLDCKLKSMCATIPDGSYRPAFIFVDHSNVIWSFLRHLNINRPSLDVYDQDRFHHLDRGMAKPKRRLDYAVLFRILERERTTILRRYIAASNPLYQPDMIPYWESKGYEIAILDPVVNRNPTTRKIINPSRMPRRGSARPTTNSADKSSCTESDSDPSTTPYPAGKSSKHLRYKEQAVDEVIQLNMIDTIMEFDWKGSDHDSRPRPILTLVSGDANAGEYSKPGFWGWVVRCLKLGWDVEIIGFKQAISNRWFQLESPTRIGDHGMLAVYTLDQFADELISDVA
ncbi:uncharacterized protein MELLADRAFT_118195 [Melampsora larici-populina 98AG31]|uniref:NYN domain-containing protein n=1 Tax=Melampsora larici-populina (strain 98AG31 / pathotype 3-4-7) TaxID=747676 RepID=F4S648_MELLP|nr:uncharacterized protein MELLADRAFT_118195 [Melampsora larici-populina 98AG31]EGF99904.1 hypothetical protein MELLADRAFT_118195 [Melampsora larici-populina 98AG31]